MHPAFKAHLYQEIVLLVQSTSRKPKPADSINALLR
jgi:hypothetical protein